MLKVRVNDSGREINLKIAEALTHNALHNNKDEH